MKDGTETNPVLPEWSAGVTQEQTGGTWQARPLKPAVVLPLNGVLRPDSSRKQASEAAKGHEGTYQKALYEN